MVAAGVPRARAAGPITVSIDADTTQAGVQSSVSKAVGTSFTVAVLVGNASDVEAFNFEVVYDKTVLSSPTISTGSDLDRNPDANQAVLQSTGRTWSCSPPPPSGDNGSVPGMGAAFLSCYSTGVPAGPTFNSAGSVVATVQFTALTTGSSALSLRNVNVFKAGGAETGSCNPTTVIAATCVGATITATPVTSVGGIAEAPDLATLELESSSAHGTPRRRLEMGLALGLILSVVLVAGCWGRRRTLGS